ncbi:MAG: lysylphosphatidylglycerol synthase domain-containing protein [Pirellula sp.]|nr:lysylphosphatidylglycerol synthase domain-containing protein [Pirellula sp.]
MIPEPSKDQIETQDQANPSEPPTPKGAPAETGPIALFQNKTFQKLFKAGVACAVLLFLAITIYRVYGELRNNEQLISSSRIRLGYLAAGIALTIVALIPAAVVWMRVLKAFGQSFPLLPALDAYYLGHAGKYVPGKAMVLVLRVGKLQPYGVSIKPAILSVFVETLTGVGTAAILGVLFLLFVDVPSWLKWSLLATVPVSIIVLSPHFFRLGLFALAKSKIGKIPKSLSSAFTWSFMLKTCFGMSIGWLLQGTVGWLIILCLNDSPDMISLSVWGTAVSAVCLGAVAGFLSMLPGGAVARDLVVAWLLAPILTQPVALLFALFLRIANLSGEGISIAAVHISKRLFASPPKSRKTARDT